MFMCRVIDCIELGRFCVAPQCFKIWDLDARGSHKGLWRFHLKDNAIFVVGVPYSKYA